MDTNLESQEKDNALKEHLLSSTPVFDGQLIKVSLDEVRLPNGKTGRREVVRHPGAVAILAVNEENKVILVEQYRHAGAEVLLEVPAGKLDSNENPEDCAFRELAEETYYTAERMKLLYMFYTAAGFCDERLYLYQAEGLQKKAQTNLDEDEFLHHVYLSKQEVKEALVSQKIRDSKTLIALQYWLMSDMF